MNARCPACQRLAGMPTAPCPECPDRLTPEQMAMQNLVEARHGAERLDRLEALDSVSVMLLLAYLDGRAPKLVDEWFEHHKARLASR